MQTDPGTGMSGIGGAGEVGSRAVDPDPSMPRRALIARSSAFALGAAVAWSAPSIRTTAVLAGAPGTPAPTRHNIVPPESGAAPAGAFADPGATAASGATAATGATLATGESQGGTLPLTGIDPKPLLIAGGTAIAAGGALIAVVHDAEPTRGD